MYRGTPISGGPILGEQTTSFNGTNGGSPQAGVTFDANGNLFGTAPFRGASGNGTVWELAKGSSTIGLLPEDWST